MQNRVPQNDVMSPVEVAAYVHGVRKSAKLRMAGTSMPYRKKVFHRRAGLDRWCADRVVKTEEGTNK